MADYQLMEGGVLRHADGAFIPEDPNNRDWLGYVAWADGGGVADPEPVIEPTPEELAAAEAREQARREARDKAAEVIGLSPEQAALLFNSEH